MSYTNIGKWVVLKASSRRLPKEKSGFSLRSFLESLFSTLKLLVAGTRFLDQNLVFGVLSF